MSNKLMISVIFLLPLYSIPAFADGTVKECKKTVEEKYKQKDCKADVEYLWAGNECQKEMLACEPKNKSKPKKVKKTINLWD